MNLKLWSFVLCGIAFTVVVSKKVKVGSGCDTGVDCGRKQCCVSNARRLGKREINDLSKEGTCQPLGRKNGNCYVGANDFEKDALIGFPSCPCRGKKTCIGNGFREIPYGETGTCNRQKVN